MTVFSGQCHISQCIKVKGTVLLMTAAADDDGDIETLRLLYNADYTSDTVCDVLLEVLLADACPRD